MVVLLLFANGKKVLSVERRGAGMKIGVTTKEQYERKKQMTFGLLSLPILVMKK